MRRSWGFRSWSILWAVLQFALPAGAAVADARLEGESLRAPGAHVEARTGVACRAAHTAECALCQFLSHATGTVAALDAAVASPVARFAPPADAVRHPSASPRHLALARAPPIG